jgi:hypothetical protein
MYFWISSVEITLKDHIFARYRESWHCPTFGQFHQHVMRAFFCMKVLCAAFSYLHVTTEKLPRRLWYKKGAHKM